MSGGKQKSESTSSSRSTLSPWSMSQWNDLSGRIQTGIDDYRSGIGPYQGDLVSGLSDSETRAGTLVNDSVGNWQGKMEGLTGMLDPSNFSAMTPRTFADFNADTYVNPYADDMIASVTGDINQATDRARTASTADTLTNGAYGGSRHGVRDAILDESALKQIADSSAGIRFNTWKAGADNFYRDVGNEMTATGYNNDVQMQRTKGLADLLGMSRDLEQQDIDRLMSFGATERGVADREKAAGYADFNRRREELMRALGLDFSLLGSVPMLVNTDGKSSEVQSSNPGALGIAGALLSGGAAAFGSGGMFGAGGFFGPKG